MFRQIFFIVAFFFIAGCCAEDNLLVSLQDGQVRGQYKQSYNGRKYMAFEGIPYAKPPIHDLRFEDPQPAQPWSGILEAKNLYACLQMPMLPGIFEGAAGQEDCLYLNVYVPRETISSNESLDVIFHIHGGAFMVGSPSMMSLPQKIMDKDVVYVSISYRLGPFGFYSAGDGHGNYGLKDQTLALRWVQKNIKKFGGNKDSVTITGLSSGGASTHLHYFSKLSRGLFHKGYAQSGVALNPWVVRKYPEKHGKILANLVGCFGNDAKGVRSCLKQRPAIQIANAVKNLYQAPSLPLTPFGPIIEKDSPSAFLTKMPHQQLTLREITDAPLMLSMTEDEGTIPAAMVYNEIQTMNSNWSKLASLLLEFYECENCHKEEISQRIKEHYLNNKDVTKENYKNVVKACTHRMFHIGAKSTTFLQSQAVKSNVYFLLMGYAGRFIPMNITGFNIDLGIGHGSDAKFYYSTIFDNPLNQEEENMKDILLDMMVSFAKTGEPKINTSEFLPISKNGDLKYLYVKAPDNLRMKTENVFGPIDFWNSLGLGED